MKLIESMETHTWLPECDIPNSIKELDVIAYLLTRHGYSTSEDAKDDGINAKKVTFSVTISIKSVE